MIRKIEYRINKAEVLAMGRSYFWHQFRQPSLALSYLFMALCPFALYFFLREPSGDLDFGLYFLVAVAILLIPFEYWRYMRTVRRDAERDGTDKETIVFEWDDNGFTAAAPDSWRRYEWGDFIRASENEQFIKLYSETSVFPAFVFKRAMSDAQIDDIKLCTKMLGTPAATFL